MALNQYDRGSNNNGANAYKKGNRTKGQPRNGKGLAEFSRQKSADITKYKEQAEKYRKARKYRQEDLYGIMNRIQEYIKQQREQDRPLTVSGTIRASGVSSSTWYEMLGGDYDYKLYEYADIYSIDLDSLPLGETTVIENSEGEKIALITYSAALQKAMLAIQEQTEERLYMKGRVGDIFALKAVHGWQEEQSPQTVNQTLVIATEEQARKAIDLLK